MHSKHIYLNKGYRKMFYPNLNRRTPNECTVKASSVLAPVLNGIKFLEFQENAIFLFILGVIIYEERVS
jgi:hypothetical protein